MTTSTDWRMPLAPAVLLIADSDEGARAASRQIEAAGASVSAMFSPALAAEVLTAKAAPDAIWVELSEACAFVDFDDWLGWVRQALERHDIAVIVALPPEMIDTVDAQFGDTAATLLVSPDEGDRIAALAIALHGGLSPGVRDVKRDRELFRLRRLAEELGRIARALSNPSVEPSPPLTGLEGSSPSRVSDRQPGFAAEPAPSAAPPLPAAEDVRRVIRMRRMRDSFFDPELFADPAWDMLLDLFAAKIEGEQVAVSSLCIAAAVPHTTALRWVKAMTADGLFERHADPADGRRIFIRLAEAPARAMSGYFQAIRRFESLSI